MPERIQRKRTKGSRLPESAVYVGRPTRYGNPFKVGELVRDPGWRHTPACPYDGVLAPGSYTSSDTVGDPYRYEIRPVRDRADAVRLFEAFVGFHDDLWPPETIRAELAGRDLACWCKSTDPCHADVLLTLANPDNPTA